jgi:sugar-specific transcriptional regulator TrmB
VVDPAELLEDKLDELNDRLSDKLNELDELLLNELDDKLSEL